jgi:hypothetical protein
LKTAIPFFDRHRLSKHEMNLLMAPRLSFSEVGHGPFSSAQRTVVAQLLDLAGVVSFIARPNRARFEEATGFGLWLAAGRRLRRRLRFSREMRPDLGCHLRHLRTIPGSQIVQDRPFAAAFSSAFGRGAR